MELSAPKPSFTFKPIPKETNPASLGKQTDNNGKVDVLVFDKAKQENIWISGDKVNIKELAGSLKEMGVVGLFAERPYEYAKGVRAFVPADGYSFASLDADQDGFLVESELKFTPDQTALQMDNTIDETAEKWAAAVGGTLGDGMERVLVGVGVPEVVEEVLSVSLGFAGMVVGASVGGIFVGIGKGIYEQIKMSGEYRTAPVSSFAQHQKAIR